MSTFHHIASLALALAATTHIAHAQDTAAPAAAPAAAAPPVNLALNKKYVSSDPNLSGWGTGLTDGSWRSERGSTYATGSTSTFPKGVTIDLEAPASIGYVALGVPSFGSTKTVQVWLSKDGQNFIQWGSHLFAQKKEEKFLLAIAPAVSARYVRLTYADRYAEMVNYPIGHAFTTEVAVYAPGAAPVLPVTLPPERSDVASPKRGRDGAVDAGFLKQHQDFLARGKAGPIGALFIGDSITHGWVSPKDIWAKVFGAYNPANFGISGDKTQHVLWRIENGELEGISPKVVVLMIGTNNIGSSVEEIVRGDKKIADEIHARLPDARLLLLGIFPRAARADDPARSKIKAVNLELARLDDGAKTRYLDIGAKFLDAEGNLPRAIMPDFLHPNHAGYQIWADAMGPLLDEMMK